MAMDAFDNKLMPNLGASEMQEMLPANKPRLGSLTAGAGSAIGSMLRPAMPGVSGAPLIGRQQGLQPLQQVLMQRMPLAGAETQY